MSNRASTSLHGEFFKWLKIFMKDKGLQPTISGFKSVGLTSGHAVDSASGNWEKLSYSQSKPQRWLFKIIDSAGSVIAVPANPGMGNIGIHSSGQGNKAALAVRILPVIEAPDGIYRPAHEMEVYAIFAFKDPIPAAGNADPSAFNPATGEMQHRAQGQSARPQPYIFAALLGVRPRDGEFEATASDGKVRTITYGALIDALAAAITAAPTGKAAGPIPVFDLAQKTELERLTKAVQDAYKEAGPSVKPVSAAAGSSDGDDAEEEDLVFAEGEIKENAELVGIDPSVYRQINAALKSGKQHIMLYGPPGTGKTTLARWIAGSLNGSKWTMITGSADWSSQDIIGGYQPVGGGLVRFFEGVLLRDFDRPLIIDELNRCDIDKVIGPLFTVLSGQQTTLPYRFDVEDKDSPQYVILPEPKAAAQDHEFAPGPAWRLVATINSIDKASLYQMSYALSRRFGWVYVDAPRDTAAFISAFLHKADPSWTPPATNIPCPLGAFWTAINKIRVLGPAPIIDAIKAIQTTDAGADFFAAPSAGMRMALLDAVDMVLLPMLDGIVVRDAETLADAAISAFDLQGDEQERIRERMKSVAV